MAHPAFGLKTCDNYAENRGAVAVVLNGAQLARARASYECVMHTVACSVREVCRPALSDCSSCAPCKTCDMREEDQRDVRREEDQWMWKIPIWV